MYLLDIKIQGMHRRRLGTLGEEAFCVTLAEYVREILVEGERKRKWHGVQNSIRGMSLSQILLAWFSLICVWVGAQTHRVRHEWGRAAPAPRCTCTRGKALRIPPRSVLSSEESWKRC